GADDGTEQPHCRVQTNRDDVRLGGFTAATLVTVFNCRHASRRVVSFVHVAGRALQRSGIQLEVRDSGVATWICEWPWSGSAIRGRHVRRRGANFSLRRLSLSLQTHTRSSAL